MAADPRWGDGGASWRALECVGRVLDVQPGGDRSLGLRVLSMFGAELVDAWGAGHVRLDRCSHASQICVWLAAASADRPVWVRQPEPADDPDWWTASLSRRRVYDLLDSGHLAELPLVTDQAAPSLLVLARGRPFGEPESERLVAARPSLLLLERLVDVLLPPDHDLPAPTDSALTCRELEVLALLGDGLLARSIATRLQVSERTVHKHLGSIYRKLDVHDRLLAVRRGESLGLIRSPTPIAR